MWSTGSRMEPSMGLWQLSFRKITDLRETGFLLAAGSPRWGASTVLLLFRQLRIHFVHATEPQHGRNVSLICSGSKYVKSVILATKSLRIWTDFTYFVSNHIRLLPRLSCCSQLFKTLVRTSSDRHSHHRPHHRLRWTQFRLDFATLRCNETIRASWQAIWPSIRPPNRTHTSP